MAEIRAGSRATVLAEILDVRTVHDGWAKFLVARVRLPDGTEVSRQIEQHGDAAAVLPYDPGRRCALLVRLFRPPALFAGHREELIEAIAGVLDQGEAAEATAGREAMEEAGVRLDRLEPVATAWASPGISTERLSMFLAPYAEADRVAAGGGLAGEHEGITVLEVPLAEAWAMTERGEIADMKTLALLMALKLRRPELFTPHEG